VFGGPGVGELKEEQKEATWQSSVIRDNYLCRVATITFAGLGRPDGVW
jgi:hypothetical protein